MHVSGSTDMSGRNRYKSLHLAGSFEKNTATTKWFGGGGGDEHNSQGVGGRATSKVARIDAARST